MIPLLNAPLPPSAPPPRRELGGGTRELVGAVGTIELAVAHQVRFDALGHALQTSGDNEKALSLHNQ